MKLQFTHQDYQIAAVQAVIDCFEGQSLAPGNFEIAVSAIDEKNSLNFTEKGIANNLILSPEQILENIQAVQKRNNIKISEKLAYTQKETFWYPHISIEMETGTGKTYTFLRTIYELHKIYGFKKYIIAVPSIAIREGIIKNLEITGEHFQEDYQNPSLNFSLYDSKKISALRNFASSNAIEILVMNIDSFAKDNNIINAERESGVKPIEYLQDTRPIVIIDEPQNFETDLRKEALNKLNPFCTLRYSATHKNLYNLVYSLNPVQAYDLGLVKQIEVDSITLENNQSLPFIQYKGVSDQKNSYKAKVIIQVNAKNGLKEKTLQLEAGADLFELSGKREIYEGYVLTEFGKNDAYLKFDNGMVIYEGQNMAAEVETPVMQYQIERTVKHHFEKTKKLKAQGIKVLSLFFIDKVANYRTYTNGSIEKGKFALWFEEAFKKMADLPLYKGVIDFEAEKVHNGYFSTDKSTKVWADSKEKNTAQDTDTYSLIMKDKEKLLDLNEPLQFIFSHSALREGWDNPNVFQICTLNQSKSEMKKRQEIGRGLRLPVNQKGERIQNKNQNVLTVIANESYEEFAASLQKEMSEAGVDFTGGIKKAGDKKKVQSNKALTLENYPLLYEIWEKISYKTRYAVRFNTEDLIEKTLELFEPNIQKTKLKSETKHVNFEKNKEGTLTHIGGELKSTADKNIAPIQTIIPDIYHYIQSKVNISRNTIYQIIQQSENIDGLILNPQLFLDHLIRAIEESLQTLQVEGIKYTEIEGQRYEMSLFKDEEIEQYVGDLLWEVKNKDKTVFNYITCDSQTEKPFAEACNADENVLFYFKMPKGFKIPTPLGFYIPDWAVIVKEEDKPKIYFVVETKSTLSKQGLRGTENLKIECAEKHFGLFQNEMIYKKVTKLKEVST